VILIPQVVWVQAELDVMKMMIVLDNWPAKTTFVSIPAAHCLVVTMLFAFLRGMPLGVDAKVAGLKTKRLENVSVNVMA
jgi:hypothetical protein